MDFGNRIASFMGISVMMCLLWALVLGCSTVSPKIQPTTAAVPDKKPTVHPSPEALSGIKIVYEGLVTSESEFWPNDALKQAFIQYWATRFNGPWEEAFALEAPHFRAMIHPTRYRIYAKGFFRSKFSELVVRDLIKTGDYLYEFDLGLRFRTSKGEEKLSWFKEQWVDVDGRWYHILKDRIIFPAI